MDLQCNALPLLCGKTTLEKTQSIKTSSQILTFSWKNAGQIFLSPTKDVTKACELGKNVRFIKMVAISYSNYALRRFLVKNG